MWFQKPRQPLALCVERQEFTEGEGKALIDASKIPLFKKIRKELHCQLLGLMLIGKASDDFRKGWIECISYVDGMIQMAEMLEANKEQEISDRKGEVTSMQMEKDE